MTWFFEGVRKIATGGSSILNFFNTNPQTKGLFGF
jgi:hypothetical protein